MSSAHTPTPWHDNGDGLIYGQPAEGQDGAPFIADVIAASDRAALSILTDRERANASFIVRACNAYDGILAALQSAAVAMECSESPFMHNEAEKARAAIAKAKGGRP
jgi:hypothetical protein